MKLAISGKGGVGKTTLAAMMCGVLAMQNRRVIAVDADPDANLGSALGVPADDPITPLADMSEMITQRTGAADAYGGYFKLNPKVDDIPEKFSRAIGSIRLLTLGGVMLARGYTATCWIHPGRRHPTEQRLSSQASCSANRVFLNHNTHEWTGDDERVR